jgi:murein L,D-transpeptidase YcbB/YkuD
MRGIRFDRLLAGTALALVLAAPIAPAAAPLDDAAIEAAVPVPTPADVSPPTAADIGPMRSEPIPPPAAADKAEPAKAEPSTTATPKAEPAKPETATAPAKPQPAAAPVEKASVPVPPTDFTGKDLVKAPIATSLSAADLPIAEKLRDLLASKGDRYFSRKNERSAMEVFYRDRGFAPVWIENGTRDARAKVAIDYLKTVDADGLEPSDYTAPDFSGDADALAEDELNYTATVLTYARHAQNGRVHYTRVSADILYNLVPPDPAEVMAGLLDPKNVAHALASYEPQQPGYQALKAKLAEVRGQKETPEPEIVRIPDGPKFIPGKEDPRVPLLRARLKTGDLDNKMYDEGLADAVRAFQGDAGLVEDGIVGPRTMRALNGEKPKRVNVVDKIVATMERWRWMPRDLGKAYVMLNIPDFTLKVVNNGKTVWTTRVVTGRPGGMATPLLTETMKFITVNPTWNVPPSIINNEYLPALQEDPGVLDRMGLKLTRNADGGIRIYQPPGPGNALGRIRFNFPNKFLVYQHDTPDKYLFKHDRRAYSHGCMRVQYPDEYAEVLLNISQPNVPGTSERIRKMYGNSEININLVNPIPVHITYQTAFVDENGTLQTRDDVYGRDAPVLALLRGEDRRIADIPMDRPHTTTTVRKDFDLPARYSYGYGYNSGPSFFERLFGGGRPAPIYQRRGYPR